MSTYTKNRQPQSCRVRFKEMVRPALGLSILVTLASLTLVAGRADASGSISVHGSVTIGDPPRGPVHQVVPVPTRGVRVDLWANPGEGAYVQVGDRVQFFFRTNADAYVTLVSVDTEGRARLLFPTYGEDGWVSGGRTYRLPGGRSDYDFRFSGPAGIEYVFAVASLSPPYPYYPSWMVSGECWDLDHWRRDDEPTLYDTGWVVGDPLWSIREFCYELVGRHANPYAYDSEWIAFHVGYRTPRHGHWGYCDRDHCSCGAVRISLGGVFVSTGHFDFHAHAKPRYTYVACGSWHRPHHYKGWYEPHGRWKWREHAYSTKGKPGNRWVAPSPNQSPKGKGRDGYRGAPSDPKGWGRGGRERDDDRRDDRGDDRNDDDGRGDHRNDDDRRNGRNDARERRSRNLNDVVATPDGRPSESPPASPKPQRERKERAKIDDDASRDRSSGKDQDKDRDKDRRSRNR